MNGNGVNKDEVRALLQERRFGDLFRKLGWDSDRLEEPLQLQVNNNDFTVTPVAEKRDFVAFICEDDDNRLARMADRRELTRQLARYHYEHLLIICGGNSQRWMLAIRPQDRPVRLLEAEWHSHQGITPLASKLEGLFFSIGEEDDLTITDVVEKVRSAFMQNAEDITRDFYESFQKELRAFAKFIKGVSDRVKREWYAALMLNRLMFIYFLQKRKFLDGDTDYLSVKLRETQKKYGKDKFNRTFYRRFLRRLFAEGLGAPESARDADLQKMIGKVPYLNGGLFDPHSIEQEYAEMDIPDKAFANLFVFFNKYQWHLNTRPQASGNEINPDVIGYIFEQYINDRASKGAYYTQEDVTGYIARNTIIPFLLERARKECANAFDAQNGIWRFLRDRPENFVYDAVKKGCDIRDGELPKNIRRGLDTAAAKLIERRKDWNKPAEDRFALPTETWRETVARRIRCHELLSKLKSGDICSVEDLITHNLDIERFAAVALESYEGADFVEAFFAAIAGKKPRDSREKGRRGITVLDPACGSGAFLFAALNVLEPLYGTCVERMRVFVDEDDLLHKQGKRKGVKKHQQFRKTLADIAKHPNPKYWIYKQIILHNLFGVDLMPEAAEIAKLRLFLKLAAAAGDADQTKENLGLEPLPDIDFNIRGGNSLVGFANAQQFDDFAKSSLLDKKEADAVREQMKTVAQADIRFRQSQENNSPEDYKDAKHELGTRLEKLNDSLSRYLAIQHGKSFRGYDQWRASHHPFHWLSEFYDIVENSGGFDVIIGNPPYVTYNKNTTPYNVRNYRTERCGDLYAFMMEQSEILLHPQGYSAMVVPLSLGVSSRKASCRELLFENYGSNWFSSFGRIPAGLFPSDVRVRNTIHIGSKGSQQGDAFTTRLHRWNQEARPALFHTLEYSPFRPGIWENYIPKINTPMLVDAFEAAIARGKRVNISVSRNITSYPLYYKTNAYNWLAFSRKPPPCYENGQSVAHTSVKKIYFPNETTRDLAMLFANGKIVFTFWLATGNDFTVSATAFCNFPTHIGRIPEEKRERLLALLPELESAMEAALQFKLNAGIRAGNYNLAKCRHITDKADAIFAEIFGFDGVWADIDLYNSQAVRTNFNQE